MIPAVSREKVLQAMVQFDRTLRPTPPWQGWAQRARGSTWLIDHDGRAYPLRNVWQLATDTQIETGLELAFLRGAKPRLEALGFSVVTADHWRTQPAPAVWWVNEQSDDDQRLRGVIGAPSQPKGAERARIRALRVGDVVVHHAGKRIDAISRVRSPAVEARGKRKVTGWQVEVEPFALGDRAVARGRIPGLFEGLALEDGPFRPDRSIKNGYLWRFSAEGLSRLHAAVGEPWPSWADRGAESVAEAANMAIEPSVVSPRFELAAATRRLIEDVAARGFVFEPWQIAAFVTALRTKPFVILAGVSGTGKSRLPRLVAQATGCVDSAIPVRPDWTDSSDVVGYVDLQGRFRPGPLLLAAERAQRDAGRLHVCVVDEMNLARVEHYFAEVLSRIEDPDPAPLVTLALARDDAAWGAIALPANLAIVGTVNMDDSAHGFSRKVLDRAFTLELSDLDLRSWGAIGAARAAAWPVTAWQARPLGGRPEPGIVETLVETIVETLVEANAILAQAQLQVGYRTRDEVIGFVRNADELAASFVTRDGTPVSPLDLALVMKLLPRIAGGSGPVRQVVLGLLGFATTGAPCEHDQQAQELVEPWRAGGRRSTVDDARFPRTAARLCLMWERLLSEGFTSFWL